MGATLAHEIANDPNMDLHHQLAFHLQSNHFPPIPLEMIKPCKEAIEAYWDDDYDKLISLPEGVGYRGLTVAPAHAIVDAHHLDAWVTQEEED